MQDDTYISAIDERDSIEQFFLDGWFNALTELDGKVLLAKLKCQVG